MVEEETGAMRNPKSKIQNPKFLLRLILLALLAIITTLASAQQSKPKSWKDNAIEALLAGDRAKAIEWYKRWMEADPGDHISLYNLACAYSLSDSIDQAIDALRRSVEAGWADSIHTESDPDLKPLHQHKQFRKLLSEAARNSRLRAGGFTEHFCKQEKAGRYLLVLPDDYDPAKPYPLVIMLHGHGQNAQHFAEVAHLINSANFIYAVPEGPYIAAETEGNGFSHFRELTNYGDDPMTGELSIEWVMSVNADVRRRYAIEGDKFWMVGYSQGGALAHAVAATHPDSVAGYAVHGGYFIPNSIHTDNLKAMKDAGVKILITHGQKDPAIGPEEAAYAMSAFRQFGVSAELQLIPDLGHELNGDVRSKIDQWLRKEVVSTQSK